MLKYQIHKLSKGEKEARAVLLEDILTSDVFGLMEYFPYDLLLQPFLQQVMLRNPESHFLVPAVEPTHIHFWKSMIWPDSLPNLDRDSIEPDVLIEWHNVLFMVEAKFISPTDPEELLREYLLGLAEAGSERLFLLLLIDKNLSPPAIPYEGVSIKISIPEYIERKIKELNLAKPISHEQIYSSLLWINWQSFYALVERVIQNNVVDEMGDIGEAYKRILGDLLLILERKGLIPFQVLKLGDFGKYTLDVNSLGEVGLTMRSSFSNLSNISIDLDTLGNIGLILSDPVPLLSGLQVDLNSLGQMGLMMQSSFSDLSDISIDFDTLGKIGLSLNDPVAFLAAFRLYDDVLRTLLAQK